MSLLRAADGRGTLQSVAASTPLSLAALILLAVLAVLPGLWTMPPMDRDEPRFAQATKQMLETGDLVNIRFQQDARLNKPVGIYWLQAAAVSLGGALGVPDAGRTIGLYRLPSVLSAILAIVLTWWTATALAHRTAALLAGAMLAATILVGVEARLAKTDAALLAAILAAIGAAAHLRSAWAREAAAPGKRWVLPGLFWTALGATILLKGPIGPLVVGATLLSFSALRGEWRWLASLRWRPGLVLLLLLVTPWFAAIIAETGGRFLQDSVGKDMLAKVASGRESHGAPPGTYLAAIFGTFWPVTPILCCAIPWIIRERRRPAVLFLLCWALPAWLVFELVPTKLPHYVLPLYPALAILTAMALVEGGFALSRWRLAVLALIPLVAVALAGAGAGAVWFYEGRIDWIFLAVAVPGACIAILGWAAFRRGRPLAGVASALASAVILYWAVYAVGMASLPTLWPSPRLAAAAQSMECEAPRYATAGYREPSLVFLVSTELAMVDGGEAADFLAGGRCRMAFVESRLQPAFQDRARQLGLVPRLLTRVEGLNLNGGRRLAIAVYRSGD